MKFPIHKYHTRMTLYDTRYNSKCVDTNRKCKKGDVINKKDVNEVDDLGQMSLLSTIICSNKDERIYKGKKNVR